MTIITYANGKHRAVVRLKGKSASETFDTLEEAQNFETRKRGEYLSLASKAVYDSIPDITFAQAFEQYFKSNAFKLKRPSTQKGELPKAKSLMKYFADLPVSKISSLDIQMYFDIRATQPTYYNDNKTVRNEKVSADYLRLEKVGLSNLYKYLNKFQISLHNPIKGFAFDIPTPTEDYDVIPEEDLVKLLSFFPTFKDVDTFHNWLFVTLYTAMRPGESSRLQIKFYEKDKGFRIPSTSLKNKQPHYVNLTSDLVRRVEEQISKAKAVNSPFIFFSYDIKGNIIPFNYSYYWRRAKEEAGITHPIKPHQLRHTAITALARYGGLTQHELMLVTGHKTFESLRRYLHMLAVEFKDNVATAGSALEKAIIDSFKRTTMERLNSEGHNFTLTDFD